jgi:hypothetical protein
MQRRSQSFNSIDAVLNPSVFRISPSLINQVSLALDSNIRTRLLEFLKEATPDAWTRDAEYAAKARLVDYRQENCCSFAGGMRCRVPFMTFQMWNLGVPCDSYSMGKYLFPIDRFLWAQNELRRLLVEVPGRGQLGVATMSFGTVPYGVNPYTEMNQRTVAGNQRIAADPSGWANWCVKVMRAVALLRWSTNLRWQFVSSSPNMDAFQFFWNRHLLKGSDERGIEPWDYAELRRRVARAFTVTGDPKVERAIDEEVRRLLRTKTLISLSRYTWDYNQVGGENVWGTREKQLRDLPLRTVKIPTSRIDFDPVQEWLDDDLFNPPLPPELRGTSSVEELLTRYFSMARAVSNESLSKFKWPFSFTAPQYEYGGSTKNVPVTAWLPSPYAQVLYCAALAQDAVSLNYLSVINMALESWLVKYEELPEQFRILDPSAMREAMSALLRAQTEAASATIGGVGGTIAGLAAAINPIAGVVVTILVAIAALVARLAQELCVVLPENPPWVASPFI